MKLLVLDIEGTLFEPSVELPGTKLRSTIWQAIATALGPEAVEAEIATHAKWHGGEYGNYLEWMRETIDIHVRFGLREEAFRQLIEGAPFNDGVVATLRAVDRRFFEPVLVSGGFRELAARAQREMLIHHAFAACEYLFDTRGVLTTYNLLPCDFAGKLDFVQLMLREYRLGSDDWVFVGDGLNDVPIAQRAPTSIAYRAHPSLIDVATYVVDDFSEILSLLQLSDGAATNETSGGQWQLQSRSTS
jgi:phosphoserine phosphatase